jgi:hypothetical protein
MAVLRFSWLASEKPSSVLPQDTRSGPRPYQTIAVFASFQAHRWWNRFQHKRCQRPFLCTHRTPELCLRKSRGLGQSPSTLENRSARCLATSSRARAHGTSRRRPFIMRNKARGQRRKRQQGTASVTSVATPLPEPDQDDFRRHRRRAWARLIRKVWCADPLVCPKCSGPLRIISFIENSCVIEKILRHLKLWAPPERPPPPRSSTTLEYDADFLAWQAAGRLFDGID